jgi:hypothetical protein
MNDRTGSIKFPKKIQIFEALKVTTITFCKRESEFTDNRDKILRAQACIYATSAAGQNVVETIP